VFSVIVCIEEIQASCTFRSANWNKGSPKVSINSSSQKNKVLVDWSALIQNKECADQYDIWVWKEGQQINQGKKFTVSDKNTLTKIVDIEPCLNHNIAVELKKGKSTEIAKFNSAPIPPINKETFAKYITVGYYQNSRTENFDVSKASIKLKREILTFQDCIKHIEVSGTSINQVTNMQSSTVTPLTPIVAQKNVWIPFGTGRQFGHNGIEKERKWKHLDSSSGPNQPKSSSVVETTPSSPTPTTTQRWGYMPPQGTPAPTSVRGGWKYENIQVPMKSSPALTIAAGPSTFTNKFLRMKSLGSPRPTSTVKEAPPFKSSVVEILVPVDPCTEYTFVLKIMSPNNAVVGTVPNLKLPRLPDIHDYVPPPVSEVVDVKFLMGGKHDLVAKSNGPIPNSCLLDYFEAVDAYANRVEVIANEAFQSNAVEKSVQDNIQDDVEKTQSETLHILGCTCTSPRLEIVPKKTSTNLDFAGVYLYQGMRNSKPYYKLDIEERSLASNKSSATRPIRRKRFIGRVDGGGQTTSTTARNWMTINSGDTVPPWRQYLGVTTHSPDTRYSNRYSDVSPPGQGTSNSNRESLTANLGSTLDCPSQNMNLNLRQNADIIIDVSSWRDCARRCTEKALCQYWVWNTNKTGSQARQCALMEGFGSKRFDANTVAGRWDCKYYGETSGRSGSISPSPPSSSPSSGGGSGFMMPGSGPSSSSGRPGSISGGGGFVSPGRGISFPGSVSPPAWRDSTLTKPVRKEHFLFWESTKRQWTVSEQLGGTGGSVEMSSSAGVTSKCPADSSNEIWTVNKVSRAKASVICSPDY